MLLRQNGDEADGTTVQKLQVETQNFVKYVVETRLEVAVIIPVAFLQDQDNRRYFTVIQMKVLSCWSEVDSCCAGCCTNSRCSD